MNYQAGFKIETKVVGVTFDNRQTIVADLNVGEKIRLKFVPQAYIKAMLVLIMLFLACSYILKYFTG